MPWLGCSLEGVPATLLQGEAIRATLRITNRGRCVLLLFLFMLVVVRVVLLCVSLSCVVLRAYVSYNMCSISRSIEGHFCNPKESQMLRVV